MCGPGQRRLQLPRHVPVGQGPLTHEPRQLSFCEVGGPGSLQVPRDADSFEPPYKKHWPRAGTEGGQRAVPPHPHLPPTPPA